MSHVYFVIYRWLIFKWVVVTWRKDNMPSNRWKAIICPIIATRTRCPIWKSIHFVSAWSSLFWTSFRCNLFLIRSNRNEYLLTASVRSMLNTQALQWCYNERDCISNHRRLDCLLNRLFRCQSKKILKLRVTGVCEGNSPMTGEFTAQRASIVENISIWWRHHGFQKINCE